MKKVILIGNPNTGKTTLFNTITKSNEHVGNWHGVTVGEKSKQYVFKDKTYTLTDLPGLYSLKSYSLEEEVSTKFLLDNKDGIVINICDANTLEKNLLLTLELIGLGLQVVLAVNMYKENKYINYSLLEKELGIRVVCIDARNKKSVKNLLEEVSLLNENHKTNKCKYGIDFKNRDLRKAHFDISNILKKCYKSKPPEISLSKIDNIVLNKFLFLPLFIAVIALVFYITFGTIGSALSNLLATLFDLLAQAVLGLIKANFGENWFYSLVGDAIFGGITSVLEFMPQVALLFFFLGLLEDVGYLPRVAYMLDGLLKKVGLTGRALFSLLMGFGCTTTAIITTRNMDNLELKKRTAFILPFMSCSAKLPVFLVFASAFFFKFKVVALVGLYFLSIMIGIIVSCVTGKLSKNTKQEYFIMEIPKYRFPKVSKLIKNSLESIKHFITKVATVILISSIVIWILQSFSIKLDYIAGTDAPNILDSIAIFIYPIFKPLGFSSSLIVVALIAGLIGKEMVVSTIGMINKVQLTGLSVAESIAIASSPIHFNFASAFGFVVFTLLYSPCISALEVTNKEFGIGFTLKSFFFQLLIAYMCSFICYKLASGSRAMILITVCLILALFIFSMLKYKRYRKGICKENCYGCNRVCRAGEKTK